MTNREKALDWWKNMEMDQQIELSKKYFPNKDFLLITTSSSRIQFIWEKEHLKEDQ